VDQDKNAPAAMVVTTEATREVGNVPTSFQALLFYKEIHMGENSSKPKTGSANSQTKGSPQAAARPQAGGQQKKPADVFVLDRSTKTLLQVRFDKITAKEEDYAFREGSGSTPFSEKALQPLREEIMEYGGIHVPILLRDLGNGTFLLVDGHRRYFSIKQLIEKKVVGYTADMLLPANVLATQTSELVTVATGLSANIHRQPLAYEGRVKASRKLFELGMPMASIAKLLGISESTVERDLLLASDEEMMRHVRSHSITATNAASLLAAASKHNRRDALVAHLTQWVEATKADIAAEVAALEAQDAELGVPVAKRWPQSRMTPELVKHWRIALEKGQDLADPGFRFKALVRKAGGIQRIEVDGLNKPVDEMTAGDVAKVLQRCVDLADALEPVLASKMAEEQGDEAEDAAARVSPGQQRLQQLGWGQFASEPDDDSYYASDDEPDLPPADDFAGPWVDGEPTPEP